MSAAHCVRDATLTRLVSTAFERGESGVDSEPKHAPTESALALESARIAVSA